MGSRSPYNSPEKSPADERLSAGIDRGIAKFFFDAHQLVVFLQPLAASGRASLQVAGAHRDSEICDKAVDFPVVMSAMLSKSCLRPKKALMPWFPYIKGPIIRVARPK
jgi:hypothetical protein